MNEECNAPRMIKTKAPYLKIKNRFIPLGHLGPRPFVPFVFTLWFEYPALPMFREPLCSIIQTRSFTDADSMIDPNCQRTLLNDYPNMSHDFPLGISTSPRFSILRNLTPGSFVPSFGGHLSLSTSLKRSRQSYTHVLHFTSFHHIWPTLTHIGQKKIW